MSCRRSFKLALLGCGSMGGALARGFCAKELIDPRQLVLCDQDFEKAKSLSQELGAVFEAEFQKAVQDAEVILLAVKPKDLCELMASLGNLLKGKNNLPLVISVAAGISLEKLSGYAGMRLRAARVMPNLCCLIGEGMSGVFCTDSADSALVLELFSAVGRAELLSSEEEFDAVTALSGSGPAYVFAIIEALADGGVKMGLSRDKALLMAAQTLYGASAMILSGGKHPAQLKDAVASPGGTTIAGMYILEQAGLRGILMAAVEAAAERSKELGAN